jgi:RIO kinase 2
VSSAERAAELLSQMDPRELRILQSIEMGMSQFEFVPFDRIVKFAGLKDSEVEFWIDDLDTKDLLWRQIEDYKGYILNYNSYDLLALNALVKGNIIDALGMSLGVGKEADVFDALRPDGGRVAVKFHRLGRVSFRDTRRKREFLANRRHVSWLYQSRLAAEREYLALQKAFRAGVKVPEPISQNRHLVVMERIEGRQLGQVINLEDPQVFLDEILENVKKSYKAGLIHSDLSEFNVLLNDEGKLYIIDWPQYVDKNSSNAEEYLRRDIANVLMFFKRRHKINLDLEDVLVAVKSS